MRANPSFCLVSQQLIRTSSCTLPRHKAHPNYTFNKPVFKRTASPGIASNGNRHFYSSHRDSYRRQPAYHVPENLAKNPPPYLPFEEVNSDSYPESPIPLQPQLQSSLLNYEATQQENHNHGQRSTVDPKFFNGINWPESQTDHHLPPAQTATPANEPLVEADSGDLVDYRYDNWGYNHKHPSELLSVENPGSIGLNAFSPEREPGFLDSDISTAMISSSSATQPPCLTCKAIKISKLSASGSFKYGRSVSQTSKRINVEQTLVFKESATKSSCQNRRTHVMAASTLPAIQTLNKSSTYLFKTEKGGHVKVITGLKNNKYQVNVEVVEVFSLGNDVIMSWGIFRSDSSSLIPLESNNTIYETSFMNKSAELEFDVSLSPFYVTFLLKSHINGENIDIKSHRNTNFCFPVGLKSGNPTPLGISYSTNNIINFALFSKTATSVILCLFDDKSKEPVLEIDLDPYINRSGDIWHAAIENSMEFVYYGYRIINTGQQKSNEVVLDPYVKVIGDNFLGKISKVPSFDWSDDVPPCLPMEKLMIYRLNVTDFTKDQSSNLNETRGTFSGVSEKLSHFKNLGVNAILLEPIVLHDKQEGPYFPSHFFSLQNSLTIKSMKEMVKKLHANGIEVLMEVVITHTSQTSSLTKIDKPSYYLSNKNEMNCAHPVVQQLILDSLRNWVIEFHIDGFCFINASSMLRGFNGEILSRPPLIEAISFDPILSNTKLIADTFDPIERSAKEIKFPHWKRWAEMNVMFFRDTRNYLRGETLVSNLATRICGSGDMFLNGRGPGFSFNFVSRNHGLTLVDSVSFSNASELSWNCGEEGATKRKIVLETRLKQIRNYLFILYVSLGVPVLNSGDECGQSCAGSVKQIDRKPFNWKMLETGFANQMVGFISFLSDLKIRRSDLLQRREFLKVENIEWYGMDLLPPNWEDITSKFLAVSLKVEKGDEKQLDGDMFAAFNGRDEAVAATVPPPPDDMAWVRLVDTSFPFPGFFSVAGDPVPEKVSGVNVYEMAPHSCVLLEARRVDG